MEIKNITTDEVSVLYDSFITEYFPEDEVKPLDNIIRMMKDGLYTVIAIYDGKEDNDENEVRVGNENNEGNDSYTSDKALGCAFVTSFPGGKSSLLDYLVVDKTARKRGYGGILLREVAKNCSHLGPVLIETESVESAKSDAERENRIKRNHFYQGNGAIQTDLVTNIFGVEYNIWVMGSKAYKDISQSMLFDISKQMIGIYRYMVKASAYEKNVYIPYVFKKEINGIEVLATYSEKSINNIFIPLLDRLTMLQASLDRRILVMLAAPPGAGKSTLCEFLKSLSECFAEYKNIQPIGMDGFHRYQDYLLSHNTIRDGEEIQMVKIKGAPVTFDTELLKERIKLVKSGDTCGWPTYNRLTHNPQDNAIIVESDIVLLEGNYLLLKDEEWDDISAMADFTIKIEANPDDLYKRLVDRKINSGNSSKDAEAFVNFSDMRNVMTCLEDSKEADLNLLMKESGEYYDKQFI